MSKSNRKHSSVFKMKVVFAALAENRTITDLCKTFSIHESLIRKWRKQVKESADIIFTSSKEKPQTTKYADEIAKLHEKIGQLVVERDFLKKNESF